MTAGLSIQPL